MNTEIITNGMMRLARQAVRLGWDVIERGALQIGWAWNKTKKKFFVTIGTIDRKTGEIRSRLTKWLKIGQFVDMFANAPHWIGG